MAFFCVYVFFSTLFFNRCLEYGTVRFHPICPNEYSFVKKVKCIIMQRHIYAIFEKKNQLTAMCTTCGERRLISMQNPSMYTMNHENTIGLYRVKCI